MHSWLYAVTLLQRPQAKHKRIGIDDLMLWFWNSVFHPLNFLEKVGVHI